MKRFPRFAVATTETTTQCTECHGKGYGSVAGFDGNERVDCTTCDGFGGWEYLTASMEEVAADVAAWDATVADVETFLGVASVAAPAHPNMTATFFDDGVRRAFLADLKASPTARYSDTFTVRSAKKPGVTYQTSPETCTCRGHAEFGRCYHRAYILYLQWERMTAPARVVKPVELNLPIAA